MASIFRPVIMGWTIGRKVCIGDIAGSPIISVKYAFLFHFCFLREHTVAYIERTRYTVAEVSVLDTLWLQSNRDFRLNFKHVRHLTANGIGSMHLVA